MPLLSQRNSATSLTAGVVIVKRTAGHHGVEGLHAFHDLLVVLVILECIRRHGVLRRIRSFPLTEEFVAPCANGVEMGCQELKCILVGVGGSRHFGEMQSLE